jgi:orotidine-5'-phosphate decarboxylase
VTTYFDRLRRAAQERRTQLCVGLDPDPERIPGGAAGALRHCLDVVQSTSEHACCYKPNSAFWEQYGPDGWSALLELRGFIGTDTPVLFDAKRADMGNTMRAYARAVFETLDMDACTIHAYHGRDSIEEFTRYADRGVYIVCRSSNPGAADLQHLDAEGKPLYMRVAELAERDNREGNTALVVGATAPDQIREVRAASRLPFLVPGIGAQGGDLEASVRAAWNGDPASCLIASSRSVLYAEDPTAAARELKEAINSVLAAV